MEVCEASRGLGRHWDSVSSATYYYCPKQVAGWSTFRGGGTDPSWCWEARHSSSAEGEAGGRAGGHGHSQNPAQGG